MSADRDIVEEIEKLIYHTEDWPGTVAVCSLLEDAANQIRLMRGQSAQPKQY